MNFESSATHSFTQIANAFRYKFDLKMNEINLYGGQVFILISLWEENHQSQIELANKLDVSAPTVNKMVKSLTERGFVECGKCKDDGRMMRVHLTNKGIEHQIPVYEKIEEFEKDFFSGLNDTEKLILSQIFGKLGNTISSKNAKKTHDGKTF